MTPRGGARVEVVNMGKAYEHAGRSLEVLYGVNLMMEPGDMVAIVGASGVGKSTFLHMLGTLDLPTAGTIRINGEDLLRMPPARLAAFRNREIGFVFQFHHLLPEFTAEENVMMPCLIQRQSREEAQRQSREILTRVGLGKRMSHKPSQMSGGEQQRVALARALVMKPSLLLADEPTGNLDRRTGQEIHELILALNREHGSSLLVVTHNPELAELMPRRLRMIDGGQLVDESSLSAHEAQSQAEAAVERAATQQAAPPPVPTPEPPSVPKTDAPAGPDGESEAI
ncbi:MAG TPA: ABC transporter ATP-binding protein [Kofleriaceae bacterium]|nr:ABC transporter ATP-binding protein [Kofleriaceae bacterium]